jgi:hypothetical protein
MADDQANAWCFGSNAPATVAPGEQERRCGGAACNGLVRRVVNQAALEVGLLAFRMAEGHYAHTAAMSVASHPRARELAPPLRNGAQVPTGEVVGKDGTSHHIFDFNHYLDQARADPCIARELDRVWLGGAYLVVGDALEQSHYFDRVPELEIIRHVRNGIAHGNRFDIRNPWRLAEYSAHNRLAHLGTGKLLEVTPSLNGTPVLFDFARPAEMLVSAEIYLMRMALGKPLRG